MTAYGVKLQDAKSFLEKLADGKNGLSLVFMHHRDSLKTGHSYQNDARITLTDHLDVSWVSTIWGGLQSCMWLCAKC